MKITILIGDHLSTLFYCILYTTLHYNNIFYCMTILLYDYSTV
jgi:hypothetical protein